MARQRSPQQRPKVGRTKESPAIEVDGNLRSPLGMLPERFLRDYWQKRPLLIRNALPGFHSPVSAEDLAGLACEPYALARLIVHDTASDRWSVENGPIPEARFGELPDSNWTLLVQDVDKWDPEVAAVLEHFRFLPDWRVDDVMISYAAADGSVGAHVDQYDVFLLQGSGHRYWMIDDRPDAPGAFRPDQELKLLQSFAPTHEWLLEPGDMLYLPPGVPHHGIAAGEQPCLTWSIGLRAPGVSELAVDFAESLAERIPDARRYADPDLLPARESGEIDARALDRVNDLLDAAFNADPAFRAEWFGRFITRYRAAGFASPLSRPLTAAAFRKRLQGRGALHRQPMSRFAFIRQGRGARLFVAGEAHDTSLALARRLCERSLLPLVEIASLPDAGIELLRTLVNQGHLVIGR